MSVRGHTTTSTMAPSTPLTKGAFAHKLSPGSVVTSFSVQPSFHPKQQFARIEKVLKRPTFFEEISPLVDVNSVDPFDPSITDVLTALGIVKRTDQAMCRGFLLRYQIALGEYKIKLEWFDDKNKDELSVQREYRNKLSAWRASFSFKASDIYWKYG